MTPDRDLQRFEELARLARAEAPAPLDVSASVLARVAAGATTPAPLLRRPPLVAAAGVSLLAAAVTLAVASPWIAEMLDPMLDPMLELVHSSQEFVP